MAKQSVLFQAFNRGIISKLALARVDLERMALAAEEQTNWMPRALGPMMLRPGLAYFGNSRNNQPAKSIPFIFSNTDTAMLEITDGMMRVRVNDQLVTRPAVSSTVINGNFDSDLSGWVDADEPGANSFWSSQSIGGFMALIGTGPNSAVRYQQVIVAPADHGQLHALSIVVSLGVVQLRIGSSAGAADYFSESTLLPGVHSIAFSPGASFFVQFSSRTINEALIDSVQIAPPGALEVAAPWAAADLSGIRHCQSGDVIFLACEGYQQRRIERRKNNSWSVVLYQSSTGPFRMDNNTPVTLSANGINGNIIVTASRGIFLEENWSSLYRITSSGQHVSSVLSGENQFTDAIRVTGVEGGRIFSWDVSGSFSATVSLQRSVGEEGAWEDVESVTSATSRSHDDNLDNQIIFYRLGIKAGHYASGSVNAQLFYSLGSIVGVVRVTHVISDTQVEAEVLSPLGGTLATDFWAEGEWSPRRGWPSSVALYEGRLWWAGKDKNWGSASDAFDDFDPDIEGDSAPINRTIGSGPVDSINWLLPLQRLVIGGQGAEISARSSSMDEPLTRDNYNTKECSTQGSTAVAGVKVDSHGVYVQKSGTRLFELAFDGGSYDYTSVELTLLCPEVGEPGLVQLAVQRQPDTRVHCVRSDGKVAILVHNKLEDVRCFMLLETDGFVEDVAVLPGSVEDSVYYLVRRVINGVEVRHYEKWALESECHGGPISKCADSHIAYQGVATSVISGLGHLEGRTVVIWADGLDAGTAVVAGGQITLTVPASNVVAGLGYRARFKSSKLAYASSLGTAILQKKRISQIGFVLADTHKQGVRFGQSFELMDDLPQMQGYEQVQTEVLDSFDQETIEFPGEWSTDSRICLEASAPRPCTVLGMAFVIETNDKS